jgi:hypothetical protein
VVKDTEDGAGRHCRELFEPSHDHHFAVADINAPNEYVETINGEGGIEVGKFWQRCEVFEG